MKIVCAWCGKDMGEKPPYEDKGTTHTICPECFAKQFPNISKGKAAADYWNQHLEHNALRSPPHGRGPDTDAGAFLAWMLEAAGDIIREIAKDYYADSGYIFEKYNRLKNNLSSRDWTDPLSPREVEALGEIKKDIEGLPAYTELLGHLKKMLLAIAERKPKEIEQDLPQLRVLIQQAIADARAKVEKETSPLILKQYPYPSPKRMDTGGIKVKIPPPRVVKRLPGAAKTIAELPTFKGPAYRVEIENWGIPLGTTGAGIIRFEQEELGNQYDIPDAIMKELEAYSYGDVVWVTKTKEAAKEYLSGGMSEKDISSIDVSGGKIITGDESIGYLVLRPGAKPMLPKAEAGGIKPGSVIRTSEKHDKAVEHLGYHSVSLSDQEIAALETPIPTDVELISESQRRLRETTIIPDDQLNKSQLALLNLTRAIAEDVQCVPSGGIFAAVIPPASDRVRTAGLYGTKTGVLYLSVDMLSRGRDAVDTHIHELAHHLEYIGTGEAEDLTPGHAQAMRTIADRVIEGLGAGRYDRYLREIQY